MNSSKLHLQDIIKSQFVFRFIYCFFKNFEVIDIASRSLLRSDYLGFRKIKSKYISVYVSEEYKFSQSEISSQMKYTIYLVCL